jgi:uncharacterized membrane protein YkoI
MFPVRAVLLVLMAASVAAPGPALARRGGDDRAVQQTVAIPRAQAVETARAEGVARLREVKLRDGRWKVEAWTTAGQPIEVEIDAATGVLLKGETYPRR